MPQSAALLTEPVWNIPWFHHVILFEKVKDMSARAWYMRQTIENGWSRNILELQIKNDAYSRAAKAVTNFERALPEELKSSLPTIEELEAELGTVDVVEGDDE